MSNSNNRSVDSATNTRFARNKPTPNFPSFIGSPGDSVLFQDIGFSSNKGLNKSSQAAKPPVTSIQQDKSLTNQPSQLTRTKPIRSSLPSNNIKPIPSEQVKSEVMHQSQQKSGHKQEEKKSSVTKQTQTNSGSHKKIEERVVDVTVEQRQAIDLKNSESSRKKIQRKVQKTEKSRGLKFAGQKNENLAVNNQTVKVQSSIEDKFSQVTMQPAKLQQPTAAAIVTPSQARQNRYQGRNRIASDYTTVQSTTKVQEQVPTSTEGEKKVQRKLLKQSITVSTGTADSNKIESLPLKSNEKSTQAAENINQFKTDQKGSVQSTYRSINQRNSLKTSKIEQKQEDKTVQISSKTKLKSGPLPSDSPKPIQQIQQASPAIKKQDNASLKTKGQNNKKIAIVEQKVQKQLKTNMQHQQKSIKVQLPKQVLKKSTVVVFAIKRMLMNRLADTIKKINLISKSNKVHSVSQFILLYRSMNHITIKKQINLIKISFQTLKKQFISVYISDLKIEGDSYPPKNISTAFKLLDRLFINKFRHAFQNLSKKNKTSTIKAGPLFVLQSFIKKKYRQKLLRGFQQIKLRQLNKKNSVKHFTSILLKLYVNKLYLPFNKLIQHTYNNTKEAIAITGKNIVKNIMKPQPVVEVAPDNPALIEKLQKLKVANSEANQKISSLQSALKNKKNSQQQQKKSITQKIPSLKQQNQHLRNQIQAKKQLNQHFKKAINLIQIQPKQQQPQKEQAQNSSTKLSLLTDIYISHYKSNQQPIQPSQLSAKFGLKLQQGNQILAEWNKILQNTQLKRQIASYEKVDPKSYKSRVMLVQERSLTLKLIKSYIKQQYFWDWIHLSAQNN